MTGRAGFDPRRVNLDQREEDPSQRELLSRTEAEERMKEIGGHGNRVIASTPHPQRTAVGKGKEDPLYFDPRTRGGAQPSIVKTSLGPPRRVPIQEVDERTPLRGRVGDRS